MKTEKKRQTIYDFIEPVLENGSGEDIMLAKKQYWKKYKSEWRKNRRRLYQEYTIAFAPKELKPIKDAAKIQNYSASRYIKEAALAYTQQRFLIPHTSTIHRIKELLALNYTVLQQLSEEDRIDKTTGNDLLSKMSSLEKQILKSLLNPQICKNDN